MRIAAFGKAGCIVAEIATGQRGKKGKSPLRIALSHCDSFAVVQGREGERIFSGAYQWALRGLVLAADAVGEWIANTSTDVPQNL